MATLRIFIVRVWRDSAAEPAPVQVDVREIDHEEHRMFTSGEEAAAFITAAPVDAQRQPRRQGMPR